MVTLFTPSTTSFIDTEELYLYQIKLACNWEKAVYAGSYYREKSKWIVNEIANQQLIKQLKQDKASDPKEKVDCSMWE